MSSLFTLMRKTQEAQAVRLGIAVARNFTDDELAESNRLLAEAERDLYGPRLIPFCVTVTTESGIEQLHILATDSCSANVQAVEMKLSGINDKPFKVSVRPLKTEAMRRAA